MNYPVCGVCGHETLYVTNTNGVDHCNGCIPIPAEGPYYYSVSFSWPAAAERSERGESEALSRAIRAVDETCMKEGIEVRHEYAWPGCSCYQYIRSDLPLKEFKKKLSSLFPQAKGSVVWMLEARQISPLTKTIRDRTVEREFGPRKLGKATFELTFDPSWKLELVSPSANPEDRDDYYSVKEDGTTIAWFPEEKDAQTFIRAKRKEWGYDKLARLFAGSPLEFGEER